MVTKSCLSGAIILLKKKLVQKRGITQKYSTQSYVPCPATASCHDEQVVQVWC